MYKYLINPSTVFNCGFPLTTYDVICAIDNCNDALEKLPESLFRSIDYKTTSAMIGCILCEEIVQTTKGDAVINPIEKGHPDIIPRKAIGSTEEQLRNYPVGLEVKCTVGGIPKNTNIEKATPRIDYLSNVTWQAHHREVRELFGITFDYILTNSGHKPIITAAFYSDELCIEDWGAISGIAGRNTKVCGMNSSGKRKMGAGWVAILDDIRYRSKYTRLFNVDF